MKSPVGPRASTARQSLKFFKGFLKNPREVGSVIPSSRFLTRRTLVCGGIAQARVIVELGPGTGVLTRHAPYAQPNPCAQPGSRPRSLRSLDAAR